MLRLSALSPVWRQPGAKHKKRNNGDQQNFGQTQREHTCILRHFTVANRIQEGPISAETLPILQPSFQNAFRNSRHGMQNNDAAFTKCGSLLRPGNDDLYKRLESFAKYRREIHEGKHAFKDSARALCNRTTALDKSPDPPAKSRPRIHKSKRALEDSGQVLWKRGTAFDKSKSGIQKSGASFVESDAASG